MHTVVPVRVNIHLRLKQLEEEFEASAVFMTLINMPEKCCYYCEKVTARYVINLNPKVTCLDKCASKSQILGGDQ